MYISLSTVILQEDSTIGTIIESKEYKTIYRSSDSDFSLNNNGYDEVHLYAPNNEEIRSVTYSGSVEGMSWSEIDGTWYQTFPTPNSENIYQAGCDWTTSLDLTNSIYEGDDFSFIISVERIAGNSATITVKGEIQDINGNVLKQYSPWTRSTITTVNTKSYTPNLADGTYQIHFWIEDMSCNDYDLTNNEVNKLVAINENYLDDGSNLDIEKIYLGNDNTARWGDLLRIKTNIYKGETSKYTVELWAEKDGTEISKRTKVNVHDSFTYYSLTLPLFLDANCNHKFSDGKVELILEGLEQEVQEEFIIKGSDSSLCDQSSIQFQEKENSLDMNFQETFELLDLPTYIVPGETVPITAQIISGDLPHSYLVWVYLYKGRTCYSCFDETVEREEMQKQVNLQSNDITQIPFELTVDSDLEPGEYKLKLKIIKDDLVTPKESTYDVLVAQIQEDTLSLFSLPDNNISGNIFSAQNELTSAAVLHNKKGIVVYESSSSKATKLIPYFLILSVGLLIFLFYKKEI